MVHAVLLNQNASLNEKILKFFFVPIVVLPGKSSFQRLEEVPDDYINQAIPLFVAAITIEYLIATIKGLPKFRLNDGFNSIFAGLFSELLRVVFRGSELMVYMYIYNNYRPCDLPWDSALTWWLCFIGHDFLYYWFHRAAHEVNFLWASHQTHHSSEDYNLTTALRQSMLQQFTSWVFYLPLAIAIPPPIFMVHYQFNMLYQFWIHTEVINSLGPLEYILNTPSHHRVHHGRNPYCIDKNYGGTFIIWDRIFGTFQSETDENVVYGLVHPLNSWDPIYAQISHLKYILETFWQMKGWKNKVSLIFKGPGWTPGSPRLGYSSDIPKIEYPVEKYNSSLSIKRNVYVLLHFVVMIIANQELAARKSGLSIFHILAITSYFILTMTSIGAMYDKKSYSAILEAIRCLIFVIVDFVLSTQHSSLPVIPGELVYVIRGVYILSTFLWMFVAWNERGTVNELQREETVKKKL